MACHFNRDYLSVPGAMSVLQEFFTPFAARSPVFIGSSEDALNTNCRAQHPCIKHSPLRQSRTRMLLVASRAERVRFVFGMLSWSQLSGDNQDR
jgi:hypothetical protein